VVIVIQREVHGEQHGMAVLADVGDDADEIEIQLR
jgi:hypothetical protein